MATRPEHIQIYENGEAVAQAAAVAFREVIANAPRDKIAVCLSGGSTPQRLYQGLARDKDRIPWDRVHWFWGDERFVPLSDKRSNAGMAVTSFLVHAPEQLSTIHVVPINATSAQQSAQLYQGELKRFYGANDFDPARPLFDLVLLGLGEDGHTASLFPGSPALDERECWVTSVEEAGQEPYVSRVTLTLPALESAREVLFLVSGAAKRSAMARVLAAEDSPATRLHPIGRSRWFVDRAAAPEDAL
jgi:6-phosphogluconolactonase